MLTETSDFSFVTPWEKSWISPISSPCQLNLNTGKLPFWTSQLINKEARAEFFDTEENPGFHSQALWLKLHTHSA